MRMCLAAWSTAALEVVPSQCDRPGMPIANTESSGPGSPTALERLLPVPETETVSGKGRSEPLAAGDPFSIQTESLMDYGGDLVAG
jgi:hypothetical protein